MMNEREIVNNTTQFGVRRAHSFDSYDNLDRWQILREHRKQFLSTQAKFDKVPPSQLPLTPPPPPPRHSSKFKIFLVPHPLSSSSPATNLTDNLKQEFTNNENLGEGNEENVSSSSWKKNEEDEWYSTVNKNTSFPRNVIYPTHTNNSFKISQNNDWDKFKVLESPGSVLKLTQSWQKFREDPEETTILKQTSSSVLEPEVFKKNQKHIEVNEPSVVRKNVDRLGYQQPTFYEDVNLSKVSLSTNKSTESSGHDISVPFLDSFRAKRVKKQFILPSEMQVSHSKSHTESLKRDFSYKRPKQLNLTNSCNEYFPKNERNIKMTFHETNMIPKYSTQENSRTYLKPALKMFTDSLLDHGGNDNTNTSLVYSNDLPVPRPRRISTGNID